MSGLQIQLLGGFQLVWDDQVINRVKQARQQALLAYLVLHRQSAQSRQHLAFLFWPDTLESQARTNLRRELHHLRQSLPEADHYLILDRHTVQWNPNAPLAFDVAIFEDALDQIDQREQTNQTWDRVIQAVDLYQGALFPTCYEEWLVPIRQRLEERFIGILEKLMLRFEDQADYQRAIRYGQQLLHYLPLHEKTYRRLMRLHALRGDRTAALRLYHTCIDLLERELNVEASQETQAAYGRLINNELPLKLSGPAAIPLTRSSKLIGRSAEWQVLRAAWQRSLSGAAQLILIAGEAGIGKTHLAEALLQSINQTGVVIAQTRSYAAAGRLAYGPLIDWIRAEPIWQSLLGLESAWLAELSRLVPDLRTLRPEMPSPEPLTAGWQRHQLFEALARAILADERPKLLLIDDLQWADQDTLEWLDYLFQFADQAQVLIVGTVRIEAVGRDHPLSALATTLRARDQLTELNLEPLDFEATTALATQISSHSLTASEETRLYQESAGNPFFVVEMVRSWAVQSIGRINPTDEVAPISVRLPTKVAAVIQTRLDQLSEESRKLAEMAATIGRAFTLPMLVAACQKNEDWVVRHLDELWRRRILREREGDGFDFSHDLLRQVAYAALSPVQRQYNHHRVAVALEQVYGPDLEPLSGQLANHYAQAGYTEQALAWYQRAVTIARDLFAVHTMLTDAQAGLNILNSLPTTAKQDQQKFDLLYSLFMGLTETKGSTVSEGEAVLIEARDLAQQLGDQQRYHLTTSRLRAIYAGRGQMTQAWQMAQEQLTIANDLASPILQVDALKGFGLLRLQEGQIQQANVYLTRAMTSYDPATDYALGRKFNHGPRADIYANLALTLWLAGYPDQARRQIQQALALAREHDNPHKIDAALFFAMLLYYGLGDRPALTAIIQEMTTLADQYGLNMAFLSSQIGQGWLLIETGQYQSGIDLIQNGIKGYQAIHHVMFQPIRLSFLIEAYWKAGQVEQSVATLDEALSISTQFEQHTWDAELHRWQGILHQARGTATDIILDHYQDALNVARQQATKSLELRAARSLSYFWQQQGKPSLARQVLAEVYDWFEEGFDSHDLRAAETLLADLSI